VAVAWAPKATLPKLVPSAALGVVSPSAMGSPLPRTPMVGAGGFTASGVQPGDDHAASHKLAVELEGQREDPVGARRHGGEGGVEGAVGVKPRDVVAAAPSHPGEVAADDDLPSSCTSMASTIEPFTSLKSILASKAESMVPSALSRARPLRRTPSISVNWPPTSSLTPTSYNAVVRGSIG
jgi:hypothetical protein